jgi:ribonuclease HII
MNALQQHDLEWLLSADRLIGVDEAGRGCLAGPVVAGACVISANFFESKEAVSLSSAINDSKQLKAADRDAQFTVLRQLKALGLIDFSVAEGSVREIADLNILGATRLAMRRALEDLAARAIAWELPEDAESGSLFENAFRDSRTLEGKRPLLARVIVDGRPLKPFPYAHKGIVKGDGKSLSIAMASIVAKVSRDRSMLTLAKQYPAYGFEEHKGYGTAKHREALLEKGPCPEHRELFLRKVLGAAKAER